MIDLTALIQVALISAVAAVGVVALSALGFRAAAAAAERRHTGTAGMALPTATAALCFTICAACIIFGVWVMLGSK